MLSTLGEIIRDLLLAVGIITVLVVGIIIVIMKMPVGNPRKAPINRALLSIGSNCRSRRLSSSDRAHPGP